MIYQISKVCIALMYMQHKRMEYSKFYIHHYLVLDQNVDDNAYSTPLRHEALECGSQNGNAGNWFVLQCILTSWYATSALSWTWYCLSVHFISINILLFFPWSNTPLLRCYFVIWCWNYLAKLTSYFWLPVCICIWELNLFDTGSLTVDTNWYI